MYLKSIIIAASLAVSIASFALLTPNIQNKQEAEIWKPGIEYMTVFSEPVWLRINRQQQVLLMEGDGSQVNSVTVDGKDIEKSPDSPVPSEDAGYLAILKLMREGKIETAQNALKEFLVDHPDHPDAWRQLGDCRYNLGMVREALDAYRIALRKDSRNYLAERGRGIAALYLGYESYSKGDTKLAHTYFQTSLNSLHSCLSANKDDKLARYGQALAAEGASRKLYEIARKALGGENHEQAKDIIRNCLDIIDVAAQASRERMQQKPEDSEARMLYGCLMMRRAKVLQPFGHQKEALDNIKSALEAFQPVALSKDKKSQIAQGQVSICRDLMKAWKE